MKTLSLTPDETNELRRAHRSAKTKHDAERIKAMYLLSRGKSAREVAEVLMLDEDTVHNYRRRYEAGGIAGLLQDGYQGSVPFLNKEELAELDVYLETTLHLTIESIVEHVEKTYGMTYWRNP